MREKQIKVLFIATVFGLLAVAFGAFGAHALKAFLDEAGQQRYELGVRYAFIHVFAIFVVGLTMPLVENVKYLRYAANLFTIGIVIFSGSLMLLALSKNTLFAVATPLGGLAFLLGWILFAYGLRSTKTRNA